MISSLPTRAVWRPLLVLLLVLSTVHSFSFGGIFGGKSDAQGGVGRAAKQKPFDRARPAQATPGNGLSQVDEALSLLRTINVSRKIVRGERSPGNFGSIVYYAKEAFVLLFMNGPKQKVLNTEKEPVVELTKPLSTAVKILEDAAERDEDPGAIFLLAEMNFWGNYTHPRNYNQAFKRYLELADLNGNSTAQHMLGFFYATGFADVVERDQAKAQLYHSFAAEQGNTRSEMTLAFRASSGIGTKKDCDASASFYKRVANKSMEYSRSGPPGGLVLPRDSYHLADDVGGVYGQGASHSSSGLNAQFSRQGNDGSDENILEYLDLLSRTGDPKATFGLGRLYYDGDRGRKRDFRSARKFFMKLARRYWDDDDKVINTEENSANVGKLASKAAAYIGRMYLRGEGVKQNFGQAKRWFKLGLHSGNPSCQYELGLMHLLGLGFKEPNPVLASKYLKEAAAQNWAAAQARLGRLFLDQGDLATAQQYFEYAALQGHIEAIYHLAEINNLNLEGRERNCAVAQSFYKLVTEKVEPLHSDLSEANAMYEEGDLEGAVVRYMMAAEQGYESAQANVAWLLDEKRPIFDLGLILPWFKNSPTAAKTPKQPSVLQNTALALIYWTRSARQWSSDSAVDSAVKMGDAYFSGIGVPAPDVEKAVICYQTAADNQGSAQAMWNLGWMHENGIGVEQDFHLAKRYYDMALDTSPEAYLPVMLALWKLRIRSRWNDWIGGDIKSMEYDDGESNKRKFKSFSEWLAHFLADEQLYYKQERQYSEHDDDDWNRESPDMGIEGLLSDEIDDSVFETLLIFSLVGVLAWLFWYRQQRQQQAQGQNQGQGQHHQNGQANGQGANGAFPPANDPNFNAWRGGGIGL